jgi:hypothetical protein
MLRVQRFQAFAGNVGVDLRRRDVGVAEQELDDAQIGAVVQEAAGWAKPDRLSSGESVADSKMAMLRIVFHDGRA